MSRLGARLTSRGDSEAESGDTGRALPAHPSLQRRMETFDVGKVPSVQGVYHQSSPFRAFA